jgi:AraC-like DNA-binding protein
VKLRLAFELDFPDYRFSKVLHQLIATNGRLSRREAAAMVHLTENSFSRTFRETHGRSYRHLQLEVRMRIAACLLKHTSLDVSAISAFLEYQEVRKFQEAFRRFYGKSPTTFRRSGRAPDFILRINGVLHADCRIVLARLGPSPAAYK